MHENSFLFKFVHYDPDEKLWLILFKFFVAAKFSKQQHQWLLLSRRELVKLEIIRSKCIFSTDWRLGCNWLIIIFPLSAVQIGVIAALFMQYLVLSSLTTSLPTSPPHTGPLLTSTSLQQYEYLEPPGDWGQTGLGYTPGHGATLHSTPVGLSSLSLSQHVQHFPLSLSLSRSLSLSTSLSLPPQWVPTCPALSSLPVIIILFDVQALPGPAWDTMAARQQSVIFLSLSCLHIKCYTRKMPVILSRYNLKNTLPMVLKTSVRSNM